MMKLNRRMFLGCTPIAAGTALAMQSLAARSALLASGRASAAPANGGYGALRPTAAQNTGETLLALPEGFQYTVFGRTGDKMSDGNLTPRAHDGMAAFAVKGQLRLVRNHEINNRIGTQGAAIGDQSKAYDPLAAGGTVTLVIDPASRQLVKDFLSLSGTLHNCAGGPTPWGSWISCEETILGKQKLKDAQGRELGGFSQEHGYCFEVSAASDTQAPPAPLKAMGRFVHEAIAVDPITGIVYETEDRGTAGLYRFIPKQKGKLAAGGRLQMLAIKDAPQYDTRTGQQVSKPLPAIWIDIADPDPAAAATDPLAVYKQGAAKGAATFARLEGCWYGKDSIFFSSTSGGDKRLGQVWEYRLRGRLAGHLILLYESPGAEALDCPDNLCVSPQGGLLICEDGKGEQFLRGLTPQGQIFDFARNMVKGFEDKELAGATFSPDGQTLFVNIQTPGLTFAIWGPLKRGAL